MHFSSQSLSSQVTAKILSVLHDLICAVSRSCTYVIHNMHMQCELIEDTQQFKLVCVLSGKFFIRVFLGYNSSEFARIEAGWQFVGPIQRLFHRLVV